MKNLIAICAMALALSACGGSSGSGAGGSNIGTPNGADGMSMLDAFTAFVASLVGTAPDNTEPVSTDSVNVTASDNTEPAKIQ